MKNRTFKWQVTLFLLLAANIYATPVDDYLEIAAQFCHFSDVGFKCSCRQQLLEGQAEEHKILKRIRRECCRVI